VRNFAPWPTSGSNVIGNTIWYNMVPVAYLLFWS